MNTNYTISALERALEISNDMFQDDPQWHDLPDVSRLRFAYALMVAFKNLKTDHE
jgi:hypothetical protein